MAFPWQTSGDVLAEAWRQLPPAQEAAFTANGVRVLWLQDVLVASAELLFVPLFFAVKAYGRAACDPHQHQLACLASAASATGTASSPMTLNSSSVAPPTAAAPCSTFAGSAANSSQQCAAPGGPLAASGSWGAASTAYTAGSENPFVYRPHMAGLVCGFPCSGSMLQQAAFMLSQGFPFPHAFSVFWTLPDVSFFVLFSMALLQLVLALALRPLYLRPAVRHGLAACTQIAMMAAHVPTLSAVPGMLLPLTTAFQFSAAHGRVGILYISTKWLWLSKVPLRLFVPAALAAWACSVAVFVLSDQAVAGSAAPEPLSFITLEASFLLCVVAPGLLLARSEAQARNRWEQQERQQQPQQHGQRRGQQQEQEQQEQPMQGQ